MSKCLICSTEISPFMSFGKMPIANGFLTPEQFPDEYFFELSPSFCPNCSMFQLDRQPEPQRMFHENYAFFSGTSARMAVHFREFAEHVKKDYLPGKDPFVAEVGCNDGIMLRNFSGWGIRHLGIEPSANVAAAANKQGVKTVCEFFGSELAEKIVKEHGQADAFLGANVMCHISGFNSVIAGIRKLLKPDGVAMFEEPYLGDVIEKTSYDQIYDEHVFLFSASSISYAFRQHGMELVDLEPQDTHGGSMRYIIAHSGARPVSGNVFRQLEKERALGLDKASTYELFRKNCEKSRDDLVSLLRGLKKEGACVAGYAATSKSTTILNYCGIGPDLIGFVSDTTPIKQGKFTPGTHIPVRPYEEFAARYPDYALLFAWNHAGEVMDNEKKFKEAGGKWITHVPQVRVLR